jgi:DNA-binding beta-propeller fold protein YncE
MLLAVCALTGAPACGRSAHGSSGPSADAARKTTTPTPPSDAAISGEGSAKAHLPLTLVADVDLPGGATRLDYQDVDQALGHLVVTHMNDGSVLILDLKDGSVLRELKGIPVARGVVVASDVGLTFVTSSPSTLVLIDNESMTEKGRVGTGAGPDGVGWDPADKVVGVSDQGDGAISLIANSGSGTRRQVKLGTATGNVVFDAGRGWFWITVESASPPDQLVAVDPVAAQVKKTIGLPGCSAAHGLRLHPDGKTAFVACEGNSVLARVDLEGAQVIGTAPTGAIPDVINLDPGLGWIYVAAESADLTVFDIRKPGVALIGHDQPGPNSHSVAVDTATHRVFFPMQAGPKGTPVLRIMRPSGT